MHNLLDRYQGCLIALAIGDALGSPLQFKPRDTYLHIDSYSSGGEFDTKKGEYSDDTAMALCLAESLLASKGFDAKNQLDYYVRWLQDGYMSTREEAFDIGMTVFDSLTHYIQTRNIITPINQEEHSGNGSLMRLAPVVLYYADSMDSAVMYAAKSSMTTHASPIAIDACRYFSYILTRILHGASKSELFSDKAVKSMFSYFKEHPLHPEIEKIAKRSYIGKLRSDIKSSGYVVDTLEAALWAFYYADDFKTTMLDAVNLGDDADSVGAVTGQLAGAYYGFSNIDAHFLKELYNRELILEISEKLYYERARNGL